MTITGAAIAVALGLAIVLYGYFGLAVDNALTAADIEAIDGLGVEAHCAVDGRSFEDEVACLRQIQAAVQAIGGKACASAWDTIEPAEFLRRGHGCCFDRARFIEKAARHYGFQTRHVFLIEPRFSSLLNLLPLGQRTHATSEILTSRGWMGVDSNKPFILVDGQTPSTYKAELLKAEVDKKLVPHTFFSGRPDVIYGLYSRHGMFHGAKLPGPEFVYSELLENFGE